MLYWDLGLVSPTALILSSIHSHRGEGKLTVMWKGTCVHMYMSTTLVKMIKDARSGMDLSLKNDTCH